MRHHTNGVLRFYFNRSVLFLARHFVAWIVGAAAVVLVLLLALHAYIEAPARYHQAPIILAPGFGAGIILVLLIRLHASVMAVRHFLATHIDLNHFFMRDDTIAEDE